MQSLPSASVGQAFQCESVRQSFVFNPSLRSYSPASNLARLLPEARGFSRPLLLAAPASARPAPEDDLRRSRRGAASSSAASWASSSLAELIASAAALVAAAAVISGVHSAAPGASKLSGMAQRCSFVSSFTYQITPSSLRTRVQGPHVGLPANGSSSAPPATAARLRASTAIDGRGSPPRLLRPPLAGFPAKRDSRLTRATSTPFAVVLLPRAAPSSVTSSSASPSPTTASTASWAASWTAAADGISGTLESDPSEATLPRDTGDPNERGPPGELLTAQGGDFG
mmetsp:Transcript_16811/g.63746  ORF Transcript_16811/g.63746 Transcript_16811/m.63746 type:complete len:285 (+) Transcript_16811:132-986(+)